MRLSIGSPEGRELASRYRVQGVPTLILLDGAGEPMLRQVGRLQKAPVLAALRDMRADSRTMER